MEKRYSEEYCNLKPYLLKINGVIGLSLNSLIKT